MNEYLGTVQNKWVLPDCDVQSIGHWFHELN
jgi:hypothetical protein